jgi:hypothetical protein
MRYPLRIDIPAELRSPVVVCGHKRIWGTMTKSMRRGLAFALGNKKSKSLLLASIIEKVGYRVSPILRFLFRPLAVRG